MHENLRNLTFFVFCIHAYSLTVMFIYHAVHTCLPPVQQLSYTWYAVLHVCAFAFTHCTKISICDACVFAVTHWTMSLLTGHHALSSCYEAAHRLPQKCLHLALWNHCLFYKRIKIGVCFAMTLKNPLPPMMRVYNSFICNLRFIRGLFNVLNSSLLLSISIFYDIYEY